MRRATSAREAVGVAKRVCTNRIKHHSVRPVSSTMIHARGTSGRGSRTAHAQMGVSCFVSFRFWFLCFLIY